MANLAAMLETIMPLDKWKHLVVGAAVATVAFLLFALEFAACALLDYLTHHQAGAVAFMVKHVAFFGILNAGACVHAAKEGMDRLDNLMMYHQGKAAIHGVELGDFLAGQAGTTVLALLGLWAGLV